MSGLLSKLKPVDENCRSKLLIGIIILLSLVVIIPLLLNIILLKYVGWSTHCGANIFECYTPVLSHFCFQNFPFTARNEWLNIHLVPHSHDDVGWLKTPEDYYDTSMHNV